MKEKFKCYMPWLIRAYLVYSVILDACVIGGIIYLIIK
jgi:hypothetical protein